MRKPSRPEALFIDGVASPLGTILIVCCEEGRVRALEFHDHEPRMRQLLRLHYGGEGRGFTLGSRPAPEAIRHALAGYFAGDLAAIETIPAATAGTDFQREVWAALRQIPPGTTLSYGALAHRVSRPRSVRAVGAANGANPISIVIPCHRVIGTDGTLTGYGGGIERKRWLLRHEGATFRDVAFGGLARAA